MNLSSEANKAALQGAYGAIKDAVELAHAKSLTEGEASLPTSTIEVEGQSVNMVYGYPKALMPQTGILKAVNLGDTATLNNSADNSEHDWVTENFNDGSAFNLYISAGTLVGAPPTITKPKSTNCYIRYTEATGPSAPTLEIITDDC